MEALPKRLFYADIVSRPNAPKQAELPSVDVPERTSSQRWRLDHNPRRPGSHAFDEIPILGRSSREAKRKDKRKPIVGHQPPKPFDSHIFSHLPTEVYHSIIRQLILLHVKDHNIDVPSVLQDLRTCCLVSKRWLYPTREHLYWHLWLLRNETSRRRRFGLSRTKDRLELLVRTLTEERHIAKLVCRLTVTPDLRYELGARKSLLSKTKTALDLLAKVIDLAPNLERIDGFLPDLAPRYASYFQALLKRPELRSLVWWTDPESWFLIDIDRLGLYEASWQHLQTLVLSQGNSARSMTMMPGSIITLLQHMPELSSLMLAGLSRRDINNETLQLLPPLLHLRLEHLVGVTDEGLIQLCAGPGVDSLHSLTLCGLQVKSMETVQAIMDGCILLQRLRFVQMQTPSWSEGVEPEDGVLESDSLQYLHWETLSDGEALMCLANCIMQHKLPALTKIKAPFDNEGVLQAVCRPIDEQPLTSEDVKFMDRERIYGSSFSLRLAQLRAQLRIQEQRKQPSFNFVVKDEEEQLQHADVIGSYFGRLDSPIEYCLEPDVPGADRALGQLSDFLEAQDDEQRNAPGLTPNLVTASTPAYSYDVLF